MPRTFKWDNVGGDLGNSASLTKAAAGILTGMTDGWEQTLQNSYNRREATDQRNIKDATNANTASLIDSIRQGKEASVTGPYNGMKVADARYENQKYLEAQAFKRRAEGRAIAAAGRARSAAASDKANAAKYAEQLSGLLGGQGSTGTPVQKDAKDMTLGELQQQGDPRTNIFSDDGVYDDGKVGANAFDSVMAAQPDYTTPDYNKAEIADISAGKLPSYADPASYGSVDYTPGDFPKYSFDPATPDEPRREIQFPFTPDTVGTVNDLVNEGQDRTDLMKKLTTREPGTSTVNIKAKETPLSSAIDKMNSGSDIPGEDAASILSTFGKNSIAKGASQKYKTDIKETLKEADKEIGKQFKEALFSPPVKGTPERKEYDNKIKEEKAKAKLAKIEAEDNKDMLMTQVLMKQTPKYAGKYYNEYQKRKAAREKLKVGSAEELNFVQKEKAKVEASIYKARRLNELGLKPDGSSNDGTGKKYNTKTSKGLTAFVDNVLKMNKLTYDETDLSKGTIDAGSYNQYKKLITKALRNGATQRQVEEAVMNSTKAHGGWSQAVSLGLMDEMSIDPVKFNQYISGIRLDDSKKAEANKK